MYGVSNLYCTIKKGIDMRTTLDLDTDVLVAAKEIARREHKTAGQVVSELLRQVLSDTTAAKPSGVAEPLAQYGFKPFPSRGGIVTNTAIDNLRDELGD